MQRLLLPAVLLQLAVWSLCLSAVCCDGSPPSSVHLTADLSLRHPVHGLQRAGVNFASPALLSWGVESNRVGGNEQTTFNWKTGTSNAAIDWFFMANTPWQPFQPPVPANVSFVDLMLQRTVAANSTLLLLVPTIGWVSRTHFGDSCWSFPVSEYGPQQGNDNDAGSGILANGTVLAGDWRCYEKIELPDVLRWLDHLQELVGAAAFASNVVLQLDNEYDLFFATHHDVHPALVSYDELWSFTVTFAAAFKHRYPHTRIAGPMSYGYCGYWWSELDGCGHNGTDYNTHRMYLLPWYLQQLQLYHQSTGVQLIDAIDLHYYPNVPQPVRTRQDQQLLLDQVRSLYDPSYPDPGWLSRCNCNGPALTLLPRIQKIIATYAPELRLSLSLSEYAWTLDDRDFVSALAENEAVAVFGVFGVDYANRFVSAAPGSIAEQHAKLWLRYDDDFPQSSLHGDVVQAQSSVAPNVTFYGLYNTQLRRLHLLLYNKFDSPLSNVSISIAHAKPANYTARVYSLTPEATNITRIADLQFTGTAAGLQSTISHMSYWSMQLLVLDGVEVSKTQTETWKPWTDSLYDSVDLLSPGGEIGGRDSPEYQQLIRTHLSRKSAHRKRQQAVTASQ